MTTYSIPHSDVVLACRMPLSLQKLLKLSHFKLSLTLFDRLEFKIYPFKNAVENIRFIVDKIIIETILNIAQ